MDADGNTVRLRWWTKSPRADVVQVFARVIKEVYNALDAKGVDMPYPTRMVLFHDQTEETDGDRNAQREGWPANADGKNPRAARIETALSRRGDAGDKAETPA